MSTLDGEEAAALIEGVIDLTTSIPEDATDAERAAVAEAAEDLLASTGILDELGEGLPPGWEGGQPPEGEPEKDSGQ